MNTTLKDQFLSGTKYVGIPYVTENGEFLTTDAVLRWLANEPRTVFEEKTFSSIEEGTTTKIAMYYYIAIEFQGCVCLVG